MRSREQKMVREAPQVSEASAQGAAEGGEYRSENEAS